MLPYIIAGEVLFWCLLLAGLLARYLLRWRTVSTTLLVATPLVDLAIIALTYVDLAGGAPSDFSHGLAAFYVGFSIIFGPEIISRADRRFARRFTDLPDDALPALPEHTPVQYWLRCLVAASITIALLALGMAIAGFADSFWLIYWIIVAASTVVLWALVGPVRDWWRRRTSDTASS